MSTPPNARTWSLAIAVIGAVLGLSTTAINLVAARIPGDHARLILDATGPEVGGQAVLLGNSAVESAMEPRDLESALGLTVTRVTDRGTGPLTWYVQFEHYLAQTGHPPAVVFIACPAGWFGKVSPVPDEDVALELARWDDRELARLLGDPQAVLAVKRRLAGRLRVREAWIELFGRPLGERMAEQIHDDRPRSGDRLDLAVEDTLRQNGRANVRDHAGGGAPSTPDKQATVAPEPDPALLALAASAERAGTRLVLGLLPERHDSLMPLAASVIVDALPESVRVADLSEVPLTDDEYVDAVHFTPSTRAYFGPYLAQALVKSARGDQHVRRFATHPNPELAPR